MDLNPKSKFYYWTIIILSVVIFSFHLIIFTIENQPFWYTFINGLDLAYDNSFIPAYPRMKEVVYPILAGRIASLLQLVFAGPFLSELFFYRNLIFRARWLFAQLGAFVVSLFIFVVHIVNYIEMDGDTFKNVAALRHSLIQIAPAPFYVGLIIFSILYNSCLRKKDITKIVNNRSVRRHLGNDYFGEPLILSQVEGESHHNKMFQSKDTQTTISIDTQTTPNSSDTQTTHHSRDTQTTPNSRDTQTTPNSSDSQSLVSRANSREVLSVKDSDTLSGSAAAQGTPGPPPPPPPSLSGTSQRRTDGFANAIEKRAQQMMKRNINVNDVMSA